MNTKLKCPCCNCNEFTILNDKDNQEYYCLINGNIKNRKLNYNDVLPISVYECNKCKNLLFRTYQN